MKLCFACFEDNKELKVFEFAGRAPYYAFFEKIKNPFLNQGGIGFKIPEFLENKKIDLFIAGNFGENMKKSLDNKKIKYKELKGFVNEILKNETKN